MSTALNYDAEAAALERLTLRPEQLGNMLDGVTASEAGLLLRAFARSLRSCGASDLAALIDPADLRGRLESTALAELGSAGEATQAGARWEMLENLQLLAGAWLADALDPARVGGCLAAAPAPRDQRGREALRHRFSQVFALELESERALACYSSDEPEERCPTCGAALAPAPELGPKGRRCFTCGPMPAAPEGGAR